MSRRLTIMLIPEKGEKRFSFSLPYLNMKLFIASAFCISLFSGYFCFDYINLNIERNYYYKIQKENKNIKSETQLLHQKLEILKKNLAHVQDYTRKINEMVNIKISTVKDKTGIGPLTASEMQTIKSQEKIGEISDANYPLGISLNQLTFNPLLSNITELQQEANARALELQQLLSSLNQKKSILSSIPTVLPVKGWITSGFGKRTSPFTGEITEHRGLDIAASIGSPIYAPADGVVIYADFKSDFGNLVMIAHYENGIVTKFAHNAENLVSVGQRVSRGDQIASVGMTGNTTGPHVHYEVWVNGEPENPLRFILDADIGIF